MGELARMDDMEGLRGNFSYSYDDRRGVEDNINKNAVRKNTPYYYHDFKENVQYVLNHFQEPLFPRTISTQKSGGRQIPVHDIYQIYEEFEKSNFVDCRISAFPSMENPVPNFVFIDLDNDNNSKISLEAKLEYTLSNIKKRLGGHPSVLWTGNGYHIYQPINNPQRFEDLDDFKEFDNPDNRFLRFEKDYLSNGYADKVNYPSIKSCLLRVPGSSNSKCIAKGINNEESKVKILQVWDEQRPPVKYMTGTFYAHLKSEKLKEKKRQNFHRSHDESKPQETSWIEKLLNTPIDDHRYFCLWRILIPYLVNVKQVSELEAYSTIDEWLRRCGNLKKIDFDIKYEIKYNMKRVKNFRPISLEDLKKEYHDLYEMIKD